jgi:hypothetical protein
VIPLTPEALILREKKNKRKTMMNDIKKVTNNRKITRQVKTMKLYNQIKLSDEEHDEFVFSHLMAMTGERLHSKYDIAYELGVRDKRITDLERSLKIAECMIENQKLEITNLNVALKADIKRIVELKDNYTALSKANQWFIKRISELLEKEAS